jgi:hypothetical protein
MVPNTFPHTTNETVPMTDESVASIIPLHKPKKAKSGAERSRAYRQRKRKKAKAAASPNYEPQSSELMIPEAFSSAASTAAEPALTPPPSVTVGPSRNISRILLMGAVLALAGVGIAMNGWFARSLGASDTAGWLFLAVGVAADVVALVVPSCAARLWQSQRRATSLAGWAVWAMTFVFAVTAGVGFASTNIADVTLTRASRVTPAVQAAQALLADAMSARDRECRGGVGKFCREREGAVNERRQALDAPCSPSDRQRTRKQRPQSGSWHGHNAWVVTTDRQRLRNAPACLAGAATADRRDTAHGRTISKCKMSAHIAHRY